MGSEAEDGTVPRELEEWLDTATRGLCDEARARIRAEITDHCLEARDDARGSGASESGGRAAALADLGDARAAARGLRRSNLTPRQAAILRDAWRPHTWRLAVHLPLLVLSAGALFFLAEGGHQARVGACALAGMVAGFSASFFLAPQLLQTGRLRSGVLLHALGDWVFFTSLIVGGSLAIDGVVSPVRLVFFGFLLTVLLALHGPLVRKLTRPDLPA